MAAPHVRDRRYLAAVLAFASAVLCVYLVAHPEMSYVDELQHFDYLEKISRGHLVHRGETVGPAALREMSCRGIDITAAEYSRFFDQTLDLPTCGEANPDPRRFPELGVNHASVHPPVYYVSTGILARAIGALTPVGSLVTAARIANVAWLILAILLGWLVLREFGVDPRVRALVCGLATAAPPVVQTFGAVGPDAAAIAIGAAILLSVIRWERGALTAGVPVAAVFLAITIKETNAAAAGCVLLYLAFRAYAEPRRRPAAIRLGALLCAAIVSAGIPWLLVQSRFAELPTRRIPMVERFQTDSLGISHVVSELDALVTPVRKVLPPVELRSRATAASGDLLHWLLLGGAFAAAVAGESTRSRAVGGAGLLAMALGGPTIAVLNYFLLGIYVVIPPRYGLSLVPALLCALAVMTRNRWLQVMIAGVALLEVIAVLSAITGWP